MSSKKWLITFTCTVVAICLLLLVGNVLVDPFGVFGDPIFHWDSYSQTLNPRVGKIEYLDRHHEEYDSYILGCSSTSSFPVEKLNEYLDAKFYNLFTYGADMLDVEQFARYIIDNYTVKNILLNVYIDNGSVYAEPGDINGSMHYKVDGSSKFDFYKKFIFLDPNYALDKVKRYFADEYLSEPYDVFWTPTGSYDKRERDVEPIGGLSEYEALPAYSDFADYPTYPVPLNVIDETMESVARIKQMCEDAGINLIVVSGPVYSGYMRGVPREDAGEFYSALAAVTPFWDFTMSSVSTEPRYFYDLTHFRNCVGEMALARIFGDKSVYIPEDFGVYVEGDSSAELLARNDAILDAEPASLTPEARVPVLLYHNIVPDGEEGFTASQLEGQLSALRDAGYTAVSFSELEDYVYRGADLPEKSVVITFDDGYASNYELAYPLLKKYGMKATIFVIGVSVGHKQYYKDTLFELTPHFDEAEMLEMSNSGLVSIQSHSYDMHQWAPFESGDRVREDIKRFKGESEEDFVAAVKEDFELSRTKIEAVTGKTVDVLAFPEGIYDELSQWALLDSGVNVTLSCRHGVNTLVKGLPQCLSAMYRIYADGYATGDELLSSIDSLT